MNRIERTGRTRLALPVALFFVLALLTSGGTRCIHSAAASAAAAEVGAPDDPAALDTDGDGLRDDEEVALGTDPRRPDTDRDGLLDGWEVYGYARDGFVEPLDAYGCDPRAPDVLVEIDWMESADGSLADAATMAYLAAIDVFRFFRDSEQGIRVHFDLGPDIEAIVPAEIVDAERAAGVPDFDAFALRPDPRKVLPYQERLPIRPTCAGAGARRSLYELYNDPRVFRPSRRNVFYYVLFAESFATDDAALSASTGLSTNFADEDSYRRGLDPTGVQVGVVFRRPAATPPAARRRFRLAASLLHELGHGLGLGHGGGRSDGRWNDVDRKPNYPSVMNRRFQFWGVGGLEFGDGPVPVLGFSSGRFGPLRERAVFEPDGLGDEVPSTHIRSVLGVEHLPDTPYDRNLDWDGDGAVDLLPYPLDLNDDDALAADPLTDHDDWSKFHRDGFDGIGAHAFRCGGTGCGAPQRLVRVPADLNGDGRTDLVVFTDRDCAVFLADDSGSWERVPRSIHRGAIDAWGMSLDDHIVVVDLDGDGRAELFIHRSHHAGVLALENDGLRLVWGGEPGPDVAAGAQRAVAPFGDDGGAPEERAWTFDGSDSVRACDLLPERGTELLVSRGDRVAVLALRDAGLVAAWSSVDIPPDPLDGRSLRIDLGREDSRGGATFLARGDASLTEFDARLPGVPAMRRDDAGTISPETPDSGVEGWVLGPDDCFTAVDLDGDGLDEYLVRRPERIAVLAERGDRLVTTWNGARVPTGGGDEVVVTGQLVPRGGEEVVLFDGRSLVAFAWDREIAALRPFAVATESIENAADSPNWSVEHGRIVGIAAVLRARPDLLIVHDRDRLLLVEVTAAGFRIERDFDGSIAGWSLSVADRFDLVETDTDAERELSILKDRWLGIVDLSSAPELRLAAELDVDLFELRPLPRFRRGDTNGDGDLDLSDVIVLLDFLFRGRASISCPSAADADDDGEVVISDGIRILDFLFGAGPPPPAPGPWEAGIDPTPDALRCDPR